MASALARAYIGGLGAMPPVGSRGETPGQGVRGAKPPWSWREFKKRNTNFAFKIATNLVKFEYCYKRRSWLKTPENEKEKTQKKHLPWSNEVHANNCNLVLISEFWGVFCTFFPESFSEIFSEILWDFSKLHGVSKVQDAAALRISENLWDSLSKKSAKHVSELPMCTNLICWNCFWK